MVGNETVSPNRTWSDEESEWNYSFTKENELLKGGWAHPPQTTKDDTSSPNETANAIDPIVCYTSLTRNWQSGVRTTTPLKIWSIRERFHQQA